MELWSKKEENKYKIDKINLSPVQENIVEEEELIWVEGYKGFLVDDNGELRSKYIQGFVYTTKMDIKVDGKLNKCHNGFHFCKELQKCFNYIELFCDSESQTYCWNNKSFKMKTIFKKVRVFLPKSQWEKDSDKYYGYKIEILDEVDSNELWNSCKKDNNNNIEYSSYNINYNTFDYLYHCTLNEFDKKIEELEQEKNKQQIKHLISLDYSETFATIIAIDYSSEYDKAIAYAEEGLSKDMRAYLLLK